MTMSLGWPGNSIWGEGSLGVPAQAAAPGPAPDKRTKMDGWMLVNWMLLICIDDI